MASDLIEHNPMLKKPLLTILSLCEKNPGKDRSMLEQEALEAWDESFVQTPTVVVDVLIRNGCLDEQVFADGRPYDGTIEDMQLDESLAEDVVAESRLTITALGSGLLEAYAPDNTMRMLLESRPHYVEVYETILRACDTPEGCDRMTLESKIKALPPLQPNPETQQTAVYPQYFIDALETAGGIAWQGSWRTTAAGKAALTA